MRWYHYESSAYRFLTSCLGLPDTLLTSLDDVQAHETETQKDDSDELDAVDYHMGDKCMDVPRCIARLEDYQTKRRSAL